MAEKPRLGNKVRKLRLRHGLTQVDLAGRLGISASYLNLIEHNQRAVTVPLLLKLGQLFEINLQDFAEGDRAHLLADLTEVFGDALFEGHEVKPADLQDLVATSAVMGRAVVALYRAGRRRPVSRLPAGAGRCQHTGRATLRWRAALEHGSRPSARRGDHRFSAGEDELLP